MKKVLLLFALIFVAIISDAGDRTLSIATGYTTPNPFTLGASDTINAGETITFSITNLQKYMQHQAFTVGLTQVTGTHSITITAAGRINASGAWVTIGTPITWVTAAQNGTMISVDPINYNYLRVTFVEGGTGCQAKITTFQVKTANAYDIPANSGTFTVSRATTGAVTITTKDDDANAATTYRAGGTGALTLGASTGTTAITSSDWAIGATGNMTGIGTIAADGAITATGGVILATQPSSYWAASGPVALATSGTDAAATNGGRFWISLNIPYNSTITGLSYLVGSVGATDSIVVQLCNSAGVQVATSRAVGGAAVLVGTAAQFQSVPFTAPYAAVSGRYYAVLQFNGTTAKFRAYPIPGAKFVAATAIGTWGTKADITPGTSYVADKGAFIMTY